LARNFVGIEAGVVAGVEEDHGGSVEKKEEREKKVLGKWYFRIEGEG
jgi:hypothetical protein